MGLRKGFEGRLNWRHELCLNKKSEHLREKPLVGGERLFVGIGSKRK